MQSIAVPYVRFSTAEQRDGGSLSRQTEKLASYIAANGWQAADTLLDDGYSGYHGDHRRADRALGQFEAEAREGIHAGKILVVERLDRLSRQSPQRTWALIAQLSDAGVAIATVEGNRFYPANAELDVFGILEILIKAAGNHEESAKKSEHNVRDWDRRREEARRNGTAISANCPPWLKVDAATKCYVIREDRAALIRRWLEMADAGAGAMSIARTMSREDIAPWARYKNRAPRCWNQTQIARIIRNRALIGEFQPMKMVEGKRVEHGEPWQGHFPAIVDHALWTRVNDSTGARNLVKGGRKSDTIANLFSGLFRCATCKGAMHYRRSRQAGDMHRNGDGRASIVGRTRGYISCPSGQAHKCENRALWPYLRLEAAILDALLHLAMDDEAFANRGEAGRAAQRIAELERSVEIGQGRAKRLWTEWADAPSAGLKAAAVDADEQCAAMVAEVAEWTGKLKSASGKVTSQQHIERVAEVRDSLYDDDMSQRKATRTKVAVRLRGLIDRIVLTTEQATVWMNGAVMKFDRSGQFVGGFDLVKDSLTPSPGYETRRAAAKAAGTFLLAQIAE